MNEFHPEGLAKEDFSGFPGNKNEKKRFKKLIKAACICLPIAVGIGAAYVYANKCEPHRLLEEDPEGIKRWLFALHLRKKKKISESAQLDENQPFFD